jgi:hypothetical protein
MAFALWPTSEIDPNRTLATTTLIGGAAAPPFVWRRGHSRLKLWPLNARYDPPIGGFCGGLRAGLSVHDFKSAHLIGSISSQARHLETRRGGLPPGASITTIGFPHFGQGLRRASATSWSPSKYKNDIPPNRQVAGVFFISSIGRFALVLLGEPGPLDG